MIVQVSPTLFNSLLTLGNVSSLPKQSLSYYIIHTTVFVYVLSLMQNLHVVCH